METRLKDRAVELGFSLVGIAPATEADGFPHFEKWLDSGFAGPLDYLHKHRQQRRHPESVFAPVRSVIMVGFEYADRVSRHSSPASLGVVARYARGPDYHDLLREKLNSLGAWLSAEVPGTESRGSVDSAPLLERDFARRAGLGWFGKNTMLIHKRRGSFFFLGALLTSLELAPDSPQRTTHCGTCTACLDACPTDAFPESGVLDARRCISTHTIELKGLIPEELHSSLGDRLFGCDICQEVCPWNRKGPESVSFPIDPALASLDPAELLKLNDQEFRNRFRGTALFRSKRQGLLRNAAIVLANCGGAESLPMLEAATRDEDPIVAETARLSLLRLSERLHNSRSQAT